MKFEYKDPSWVELYVECDLEDNFLFFTNSSDQYMAIILPKDDAVRLAQMIIAECKK